MCWYFTLISMLVVVLTIFVVGLDISKGKSLNDSFIFEDCTIEELQYYATIQPDLMRFMTCESKQGIYHSVPMVTRSNSSYPSVSVHKCNDPKSGDIYDILPVYHSSLEINFRNMHCLLNNYDISIDKSMYFNTLYHKSWRMYVSRDCFYANIARVTKKAFSSLLKLLTTGDNCSPMFLPPRMVHNEWNMSRFYHNLRVQCLNSETITSTQMMQIACKLCTWLFDEYFAPCKAWNGTGAVYINVSATYTNVVLHEIDSKGLIVTLKSQRCLARGCFEDQCKSGELGYGSNCFKPVEYIDGVVSELWISHSLPDEGSIHEAIVAHLYCYVLNDTNNIAIRIVDGVKASDEKVDECAALKVVLITKTYMRPDELSVVFKNVEELQRKGKIEISHRNTQSIIQLHSRPKTCTIKEVNDYLQTSQEDRKYILLAASIISTLLLMILAATVNIFKKHLHQNT